MSIATSSPGLNILVVGPSWVGDMVMAQSLFMVLKRLHPDCAIDVLAPAWSRPLLAAMPEVRASLDMPVGHGSLEWSTRRDIAETLRGLYDWAIVLPNSLKSALIPWMARIPRRTGWRGEMRYGLLNDLRRLDEKALPLMVQRFVALAYDKGQEKVSDVPHPALHLDPSRVAEIATRFGVGAGQANRTAAVAGGGVGEADGSQPLPAGEQASSTPRSIDWSSATARVMLEARADKRSKVLGLCPGAEFGLAKQWPEAHYAALARAHLAAGGEVWLFGSAKDRTVTQAITARLDEGYERVKDLAGQTSLEEAVALLSLTHQVVSNDSGLMHVAAALRRPLVAVYGSTSPEFTPPLGDKARIVRTGISCSPCFKRECPYGHYQCLRDLPPRMVIDALKDLS